MCPRCGLIVITAVLELIYQKINDVKINAVDGERILDLHRIGTFLAYLMSFASFAVTPVTKAN